MTTVNHISAGQGNSPGECTNYQTGKEDGTVINTISYMLNQD